MDRTKTLFLARIAGGLAVGLFVARLVAEATRAPWPPPALAALAVCSCAVFAWVARRLDRRSVALPSAPAFVLLAYVFWPQRDGRIALMAAAIALLAWAIGVHQLTKRCASHLAL